MTGASEGNYAKIKIVKKTDAGGINKHVTRFLAVDQQETEMERSSRKAGLEEVVVLDQDDLKEFKSEVLEIVDEDPDDPLGEEPVHKKSRLG